MSLLITACGGGAGSEDEVGNNKPQPASSSSTPIISSSDISSSLATSSRSSVKSSSSIVTSSRTPSSSSRQEYSRAAGGQESSEVYEEPNAAPTQPTNPEITMISNRKVGLKWGAASDDTGVGSYEIIRNGSHIGTTTAYTMTFEDQGLTPATSYRYAIRAVDTSGNRSPATLPIEAKTLGDASSSSSQSASSRSASSGSSTSSKASSTSNTSATTSSTSNTSAASSTSNSNSSKSSTSVASGSINLTWSIPNKREDGSFLELEEIDGYELRHKPRGSTVFISRLINDATIHSFVVEGATHGDTFEIAAYDRNGLYSKFISLTPL
ncbi:fibronectin type III domain-containing protein [Cellvibrio mixtus]|uniref:fibronectin type III domain-containing protein n=1 Tax=Cellvibrio mixtus TaxID=39650 RepID=UPI001269A905|nr:fibronectin type III domain-containing protein [Cellvibrio mixtus]